MRRFKENDGLDYVGDFLSGHRFSVAGFRQAVRRATSGIRQGVS
jgi:hypothetical protein